MVAARRKFNRAVVNNVVMQYVSMLLAIRHAAKLNSVNFIRVSYATELKIVTARAL